jgi:hypothetical protein
LFYIYICISLYGCTASWTSATFFSFLIQYTVGRTPWTGVQPVARPQPTHRTTQTQNKHTQTSMPRVGFQPMTPMFKRVKTVHALDHTATVISIVSLCHRYIKKSRKSVAVSLEIMLHSLCVLYCSILYFSSFHLCFAFSFATF